VDPPNPPAGGTGPADPSADPEVLDAEVVDEDTPASAPAPEPQKPKRTRAPKDPTPEPEIPDWVPRAEWDAFDASRQRGKGKASWTPTARVMALRTLADLKTAGEDLGAVLRASVVGGWSGLFPQRRGGQAALPLGGRAARTASRDDTDDLLRAAEEADPGAVARAAAAVFGGGR